MSKKKIEDDLFNLKATPKEEIPEELKIVHTESLDSKFEAERKLWKDIVLAMANKINDITKIGELQVELYSNRQICLEHNHFLMSLLSKIQKDYKKKIGKKWDDFINL